MTGCVGVGIIMRAVECSCRARHGDTEIQE